MIQTNIILQFGAIDNVYAGSQSVYDKRFIITKLL